MHVHHWSSLFLRNVIYCPFAGTCTTEDLGAADAVQVDEGCTTTEVDDDCTATAMDKGCTTVHGGTTVDVNEGGTAVDVDLGEGDAIDVDEGGKTVDLDEGDTVDVIEGGTTVDLDEGDTVDVNEGDRTGDSLVTKHVDAPPWLMNYVNPLGIIKTIKASYPIKVLIHPINVWLSHSNFLRLQKKGVDDGKR